MNLEIFQPSYPLSLYIKSIICYENYSGESPYESVLPILNDQLIIELDGNDRLYNHSDLKTDHFANVNRSWLVGLQSKPITYISEKNANVISVQFQNGGLYTFFNIPSDEFQNKIIDSSLILPHVFDLLREQIAEQKSLKDKIKVLRVYFENQIKTPPNRLLMAKFIIQNMCIHNHSLSQLSQSLGYSQKHLIHIFKNQIGVTPKQFQKRFRFNSAIDLLHLPNRISYTDIALRCNYFDQAHFINNFKDFALKSPTEYSKIKKDYPHVLPLNSLR